MYGEIMHLRFAGESARAFAKSARKEVTPNHNASAAEKNREIPNPVRTQKMREGGESYVYREDPRCQDRGFFYFLQTCTQRFKGSVISCLTIYVGLLHMQK